MWWVHPPPPPWSLQQYDPLSILKRRQSQINKTISLLNYIYLHFYQIYYFTTQQATNFCKFQNLRSIHWCKYIWYWYISLWVFYQLYKMKKNSLPLFMWQTTALLLPILAPKLGFFRATTKFFDPCERKQPLVKIYKFLNSKDFRLSGIIGIHGLYNICRFYGFTTPLTL